MNVFSKASIAFTAKSGVRWGTMVIILIITIFAALSIGRYNLPVSHVVGILVSAVLPDGGAEWLGPWTSVETRVVLQVRLPRILMALCVGASLAMSGAALQGIFRNPLVGPQILGISSGAALGGCFALLLFSSLAMTMGLAFMGGVVAIVMVYLLARYQGQTSMLMLVLAGIVTSAFLSACISLVTYFADTTDTLPAIVFWLMGSFATATYTKLLAVVGPIAIGMVLLMLLRFRINVLSLGDEQAQALGISVEGMRWLVLICITLIVSASVAVSGTVGWVGLVVPHIARMLVGSDHRVLLPASALMGGVYMLIVDTFARSATSVEIPLGVITAIIGAPVFAWLIRRTQKKGAMHD